MKATKEELRELADSLEKLAGKLEHTAYHETTSKYMTKDEVKDAHHNIYTILVKLHNR
tara:strand:- start:98 stop:271 length:174 start_codon:yes stop_codon:yes gene_type:complete